MGLPSTGQVYACGNQLTRTGLTKASAALTTLLYSGEFSDLATGLQYLRARFYNPTKWRISTWSRSVSNADEAWLVSCSHDSLKGDNLVRYLVQSRSLLNKVE